MTKTCAKCGKQPRLRGRTICQKCSKRISALNEIVQLEENIEQLRKSIGGKPRA